MFDDNYLRLARRLGVAAAHAGIGPMAPNQPTSAGFSLPGTQESEDGAQAEQTRPEQPQEKTDPNELIPAPDGSLDYGEITPEMTKAMRRQAGKIRLRRGTDAWGLRQIEQRHDKDVRALGYDGVIDFVSTVARNFSKAYQGRGRALDVVIDDEALAGC